MHHQPHLNKLTTIHTYILIALSFVVFYIYFLYFLSAVTAIRRNSPHKVAVLFLNLFFGFTLLGGFLPCFLPANSRSKWSSSTTRPRRAKLPSQPHTFGPTHSQSH